VISMMWWALLRRRRSTRIRMIRMKKTVEPRMIPAMVAGVKRLVNLVSSSGIQGFEVGGTGVNVVVEAWVEVNVVDLDAPLIGEEMVIFGSLVVVTVMVLVELLIIVDVNVGPLLVSVVASSGEARSDVT
jgi:hypothetical protein